MVDSCCNVPFWLTYKAYGSEPWTVPQCGIWDDDFVPPCNEPQALFAYASVSRVASRKTNLAAGYDTSAAANCAAAGMVRRRPCVFPRSGWLAKHKDDPFVGQEFQGSFGALSSSDIWDPKSGRYELSTSKLNLEEGKQQVVFPWLDGLYVAAIDFWTNTCKYNATKLENSDFLEAVRVYEGPGFAAESTRGIVTFSKSDYYECKSGAEDFLYGQLSPTYFFAGRTLTWTPGTPMPAKFRFVIVEGQPAKKKPSHMPPLTGDIRTSVPKDL